MDCSFKRDVGLYRNSDRLIAWRQFLLAVINAPLVSARLIEQITRLLLSEIKLDHAKHDLTLITLLSEISQRYPLPLRSAIANYVRSQDLSDIAREELDEIIKSLNPVRQ